MILQFILAAMLTLVPAPRVVVHIDLGAAEKYYRDGKYDLALGEYEAAIAQKNPANDESDNPRVYYNAGNCAFRLQRYPLAALYYHRSLLRDPRDAQARFNLRLTERKLAMAPPPAESVVETVLRAFDAASPGQLLFYTAAVESAALALIVLFRKRRGAIGSGFVLLIIAGATGYGYIHKTMSVPPPRALVMAPEIKVYSEPRDDLPVLVTLKTGEVLDVLESTDRWLRVRSADRGGYGERGGWTPSAGVGMIY
ncbi:MAG: hypothetical protein HY286_15485 [Planctomycetes bacterium]|nr:hypothetical protein [Planctomycetota bacterium]